MTWFAGALFASLLLFFWRTATANIVVCGLDCWRSVDNLTINSCKTSHEVFNFPPSTS